jgi:hypothetical protein
VGKSPYRHIITIIIIIIIIIIIFIFRFFDLSSSLCSLLLFTALLRLFSPSYSPYHHHHHHYNTA